MYKEIITYTDYDGQERTETVYFNLTKAEVAELQMSKKGGIDKYIQKLIDEQDIPEMSKFFKDFIFHAYGVKSEDGRRFIKSDELSTEFSQTEAYSEIVYHLLSDEDYMNKVMNAILPAMKEGDNPAVALAS